MNGSGASRPRHSRAETKQQLLAAARRLVLRDGSENLCDVRLVDVVREEGMTTGAAYQIWDSQDDFRRDLAVYVASAFEWAGPGLIAEKLRELLTAGASQEERLRVVGRIYFDAFGTNEEYFAVLQLYALRNPPPELAEALQRGYDIVHEGFARLFEALLEADGRRLRAPYTIDDLVVVVAALTEGLALRARVQPDRVRTAIPAGPGDGGDWHLYSAGLLAASRYFTEDDPDV